MDIFLYVAGWYVVGLVSACCCEMLDRRNSNNYKACSLRSIFVTSIFGVVILAVLLFTVIGATMKPQLKSLNKFLDKKPFEK